jgi:Guanine nucleotide exchange factor synembryn
MTYVPTAIETAALSESLKLLFNLSNFYPHRVATFTPSLESIFKIIANITIPTPPLEAPVNYLINALVNLDLENGETSTLIVFPTHNQRYNVDKLINILNQAVLSYKPSQLETLAVPIVTVLRKIYHIAPEQAKKSMQQHLLPAEKDRDLPVGKSDSLSSRLLRLSTSAVAPSLREGISSLMFELSGKDASQFVRNVGYGFAAGYLMSHDIPMPASAKETREDRDSGIPVNPITGQRLDKEPVSEEPEMTAEEKEREAERLFVLFERLRATGVVDVQNPVRQAMEEGKFDRRIEEVDDPD